MAFTAADVKKLREMTNVGMMDCKKALTETDGDMDKAIEWLREKGLAKAAKKAEPHCGRRHGVRRLSRTASALSSKSTRRPTLPPRPPVFVDFVKDIAKVVVENNPADLEALKACKYPGSDLTVAEMIPEKVMVIGENLQIRRFARFGKNTSVSYVHAGGKIGVLVNLEVCRRHRRHHRSARTSPCRSPPLNPRFWDKSLTLPTTVLEEEKQDPGRPDGQRPEDGFQAPAGQGKDRRWQAEQVLRRKLPAAAGLRQGWLHVC